MGEIDRRLTEMMSEGSLGTIDALLRSVAMSECRGPSSTEIPVVCTVSTAAGAGGREVAQALAERLNIGFFDKDILQRVAKETHTSSEVLKRLDECVEGMKGAWLRSLLTGEDLSKETFRRNLINVILGIGCKGGVILGRGGNFILAHRPVLRVRVVGSSSLCARRIAQQQGIDPSAAELVRRQTDDDRRQFIRILYGNDISDPLGYDLVLNSDHFRWEALTEIAVLALQRRREHALEQTSE
jgi:cytidylate kinase